MRFLSIVSMVSLTSSLAMAQEPNLGYPPPTYPPQAPAPAPAPPGSPDPNLPSAGGLVAPAPIPQQQASPETATQAELRESEQEDSGRGLSWLWIDADGGFQHVGLETFDVNTSNLTAGLVSSEASGSYVGAGLGLQLLFLRIGPRGRVGFFNDWQMFSVGGEAGLRIPLGFLEPHVDLGGGYVALGNLSNGGLSAIADKARVSGAYARIGGGLDIFLGKIFSIGPYASWEVMGLTRPGVSFADLDPTKVSTLNDAQKTAAAAEGSGYGSAVTVGARVGLSL